MTEQQSGGERREHPRVVGFELISYEEFYPGAGPAGIGLARTVDLSVGGLGIESAKPLPLGATVNLRLAMREEVVQAQGRVVRLEEKEENVVRIGIMFTDLSPEAKSVLAGFIGDGGEAGEVKVSTS